MIISTNSIASCIPPQISTEEAAQAFMQNSPAGSVFKYIGQTTENLTNGSLYEVTGS